MNFFNPERALALRSEPGDVARPACRRPRGLGGVELGDFWQPDDPLAGQLAAVGSSDQPGQERVFRAGDNWRCRSHITDLVDPAGVGCFYADWP